MFEENLTKKIEEWVRPFLEQQKIELVDLHLKRRGAKQLLRFLVEKSGGVTLDDCIFLNEEISRILDHHQGFFTDSYILEVSSPGIDRPLKTERDFIRVMGKEIKVYLKESLDEKLEYRGESYDCLGGKLMLKVGKDEIVQIPLEIIQKGQQVIK